MSEASLTAPDSTVGRLLAEEGHFTGRIVNVTYPFEAEILEKELGLKHMNKENCERILRDWLSTTGQGQRLINECVDYGIQNTQANIPKVNVTSRPFRALLHEYVHWRILKGTSMGTIVDAISWRLRFDQLYIAEKIHRKIRRLPRLLNETTVELFDDAGFREEITQALMEIGKDRNLQEIFADLVTHHYYLSFYYQTMLATIVEPATWALVEPDWLTNPATHLQDYFGDKENILRKKAQSVLDEIPKYLHASQGLPDEREKWLKAFNTALDFPVIVGTEYGGIGNESDEFILSLFDFIFERGKSRLRNKVVLTSPAEDKRFATVLSYALRVGENTDTATKDMIDTFVTIAKREPELISFAIQIAARWGSSPSLDQPFFIMNVKFPNGLVKVRIDPLTGLIADSKSPIDRVKVRLTGQPINKIDDCVGDLPNTLSIALYFLYFLGLEDSKKKLLQFGQNIPFVGELEEGTRLYERYSRIVNDDDFALEVRESGLSYQTLAVHPQSQFTSFIIFWFILLSKLGVLAKHLFIEHGMPS